jgi:hypothetical protein
MSDLIDRLVAQVLGLEVRLLACQARLSARTDPEALHDLRTTVRRMRSLLRPLRGLPGVEQLEAAASAVGSLTTPCVIAKCWRRICSSTVNPKRLSDAWRRWTKPIPQWPQALSSTNC